MAAEVFVGGVGEFAPSTRSGNVVNRRALICSIREKYELLGLVNRKCLQHDGVNKREDSGVRTDTKRQSRNRDHREPRTLQESSYGVPNVLQQCFHNNLVLCSSVFGL